ncbi:elongation factor P maturation arginine rhamnosyltransferase EarP [Cellvibrio sp.]|uniref:elongation factor P maturation arginine rhamnosyltransferase EarP n=1 Tax=Cellvibrio sp. TaxID=1965322 RepID=UPI003964835F
MSRIIAPYFSPQQEDYMSQRPFKTWDIFCRVVDNFGDIGVCWRLARQLAVEYPFQVRLWVDEISALTKIWPNAVHQEQQELEHVDVRIWHENFDAEDAADVVIEAFACELPATYLAAMKRRATAPHWFNLEYLSAEDWVEGCHGLLSPHPSLGLKKVFFFPGFTLKTGGLLKEASLIKDRDTFLSDIAKHTNLLSSLGVSRPENALVISLFGYENGTVSSLLDSWVDSSQAVLCLVPEGKILGDINRYFGKQLCSGDEIIKGALTIKVIPFLSQSTYDQLLWACDLNFVRGEDSFARAQWAQRPFVWHIYPQEDDIHLAKLDAFLNLYLDQAPAELAPAIAELWRDWNQAKDVRKSWEACVSQLKNWQTHSQNWCQHLNSLGDLASNMVQFCQKTL